MRNYSDKDYNWFKTDSSSSSSSRRKLSFSVILEHNMVKQDNEVFSLQGHPNKLNYAHQLVLKQIFNNIRDFFLVHAGVVGKNGNVLILAGSPGVGKTTMVSELVKDGFDFFSDDFCPIHKHTGLVHPFPRSMWKVSDRQIPGSLRKNKIPIRTDEIQGHIADMPGKITCLICLEGEKRFQGFYRLEMGLEQGKEAVTDDLINTPGVTVKQPDTGLPEWHIQYPRAQGLNRKIRQILEKHRAGIRNVFLDDSACPDFTKEPVLTKISSHEAAFHLIKDFKNEIMPGQTPLTGILMRLCMILDHARCCRLSAGNLESMKKIIMGLFSPNAKQQV